MSLAPPPSPRIAAFDGLRGIAAVIVVLYHYLCLLHPHLTPSMGRTLTDFAHTPVHILWNGRFAVAVFFVLSGFVMAAAAERRRHALLANVFSRYVRLALPVTASCLVAWAWLVAFPDAALRMQETVASPSRWLSFTYQEPLKPIWIAVADGMAANFVRGFSRFNNVLWTMKFEFLGSIGIFLLYYLSSGRLRLTMLAAGTFVVVLWLPDPYLAFVLGAGLYEMHRRGLLRPLPGAALPVTALLAAFILGSPGEGAHARLDLPEVPESWELGEPRGLMPVLAATLLLYAVLTLPMLARLFETRVPLFLGRISFGLYLVHVPPLYTVVAWTYLSGAPEAVIAPAYAVLVLALALIFTRFVDEPVLALIAAVRGRSSSGTRSVPADA
ncbi:acyltransferase family protein [Rhodobacter sp. NSM]|uniref:acyltransferase family protein n=1 Tax=Rhodobacter sp. NSM TaxID=3457501 RepID=UPI003FD4B9CC